MTTIIAPGIGEEEAVVQVAAGDLIAVTGASLSLPDARVSISLVGEEGDALVGWLPDQDGATAVVVAAAGDFKVCRALSSSECAVEHIAAE